MLQGSKCMAHSGVRIAKIKRRCLGMLLNYLPYVECDPRGKNSQAKLCRDKHIKGFPTWEIDGEFYASVQSLNNLADLSGYEGSRQ
jgi:hypothetical protein